MTRDHPKSSRSARRWRRATIGLTLLLVLLLLSQDNSDPVPPDTLLPNRGTAPAEDPMLPIARRYAPVIYHATAATGGRQDLPSNIDFDGDYIGNNNWEHFEQYTLIPTLYYAVLETDTHYFIAYHLFHPRDWNHFTVWLHDTHENDGENLQVVVRKSDGQPILLWTQAHYRSQVYIAADVGIAPGSVVPAGPFQRVDDAGRPNASGTHPAVFVEAFGHGIYGTMDRGEDLTLHPDGRYTFGGGNGLRMRPARLGEPVPEPARTDSGTVPYQLDSITEKLWPRLRDGILVGDGRLLDRPYVYRDTRVVVDVPRYYDGDRFSGPLGPDRGISPFALDFGFEEGTLGSLFFDPARRYAEGLTITGPWSLTYLDYPFGKP